MGLLQTKELAKIISKSETLMVKSDAVILVFTRNTYCILKGFVKNKNDNTIVTAFRQVVTAKEHGQVQRL